MWWIWKMKLSDFPCTHTFTLRAEGWGKGVAVAYILYYINGNLTEMDTQLWAQSSLWGYKGYNLHTCFIIWINFCSYRLLQRTFNIWLLTNFFKATWLQNRLLYFSPSICKQHIKKENIMHWKQITMHNNYLIQVMLATNLHFYNFYYCSKYTMVLLFLQRHTHKILFLLKTQ